MAVYGDREERSITYDQKGVTGRRVIICDWTDVDPSYDGVNLPQYGDVWPSMTAVNLKCVSVECKRYGLGAGDDYVGLAEVIANYSTEGDIVADFYQAEMGVGVETVDCGLGWKWTTAGSPLEKSIPFTMPTCTYRIIKKQALTRAQLVAVALNTGKINNATFHGFAAYCLRFDGIDTSENYNSDGSLSSAITTYKFTSRSIDWRYMWHEPEIVHDYISGNPIYWQNKIATDDAGVAMPNYTTDTDLVGTPMWIDGVRGNDGVGYWDKPTWTDATPTTHYLYDTCTFTTALSLPA